MAFYSQTRSIATVGKRFLNQIWTPSPSPATSLRRGVHASVYDKNVEDQVQGRPNVVPDDVVHPQSDKYWAPHPQTGVFGPASELGGAGEGGLRTPPAEGGGETVLEQQTFFRPLALEDVEKPAQPYTVE